MSPSAAPPADSPSDLQSALARIAALENQIASLKLQQSQPQSTQQPQKADVSLEDLPDYVDEEPPLLHTTSADAFETLELKVYAYSALSDKHKHTLYKRPVMNTQQIMDRVKPIIDDVKTRGDAAIIDATKKFDGVDLVETAHVRSSPTHTVMRAPYPAEIIARVPPETRAALDVAFDNIKKFHEAQVEWGVSSVETMEGVSCSRFPTPITRVGLYVPGGTAVLPSTALMLSTPALVARVPHIVLATPPRRDGSVCPEVVYVAAKAGVEAILVAGGAQAVAALAYGTQTVPKVDKIFGPGNQYVTAAKLVAQNDFSCLVSADLPAGPSEVLVICDSTVPPAHVALDLLSQAEHGADSQAVLLTVGADDAYVARVVRAVQEEGAKLPRNKILRESVSKSYVVRCETVQEAFEFSNGYAPEHLVVNVRGVGVDVVAREVKNAGSVFVGRWAPVSCGDYASGTNHTLPTYGYARSYSGLGTGAFLKYVTVQSLTYAGLKELGKSVIRLADVEELKAHGESVRVRIEGGEYD
ncbi:histidinol dehydrogenase [Gonapodya prolifera JEL478]|uniref:Histidinol dehydrogenase n=1 Tax=Gonapodya prolifera (strain JEL478) TaxID=1344416 RepID=A0A139AWR6_GONPJ|nr:histidinol dehydrogenase [Gonapodya prolifera JEL478]|eukprot:KXS21191.1 histidinol dehydrogenase [Gonapodya prolifera JEL478]